MRTSTLLLSTLTLTVLIATAAAPSLAIRDVRAIEMRTIKADGTVESLVIFVHPVERWIAMVAEAGDYQMFLLDDRVLMVQGDGRCMAIDRATAAQLRAQREQARRKMEEMLQSMPPEARKNIPPGMLEGFQPPTAEKTEIFETSETKTVDNQRCTVYILRQGPAEVGRMCVVPWASIPGGSELATVFAERASLWAELMGPQAETEDPAFLEPFAEGLPIEFRETVSRHEAGIAGLPGAPPGEQAVETTRGRLLEKAPEPPTVPPKEACQPMPMMGPP